MNATNPTAATAARLESALDLIAECIVMHDRPQFAPYVERLERELEALLANDDVMARARRRVESRAANDNKQTGAVAA